MHQPTCQLHIPTPVLLHVSDQVLLGHLRLPWAHPDAVTELREAMARFAASTGAHPGALLRVSSGPSWEQGTSITLGARHGAVYLHWR